MKQDDEFVVNYCLEAQWITYETTQEMLNYAKARVSSYNIYTCEFILCTTNHFRNMNFFHHRPFKGAFFPVDCSPHWPWNTIASYSP